MQTKKVIKELDSLGFTVTGGKMIKLPLNPRRKRGYEVNQGSPGSYIYIYNSEGLAVLLEAIKAGAYTRDGRRVTTRRRLQRNLDNRLRAVGAW